MRGFDEWFERFAGFPPHGWQRRLALDETCRDRLIRIPTGLGKTAGTVGAWAWNRVVRGDEGWPRRLVFCLPMRVLVEQTEAEVRRWLGAIDADWDGTGSHRRRVGVHVLMGGADAEEWHLHPEETAILVGTQDMLLSRALNRGYGSARARWPMEFALLHHDALWVLDEVQLMDVGLATSAQLQAFRADEAPRGLRPCRSWWMSATTQDAWLRTCVDFAPSIDTLRRTTVGPEERTGSLWTVKKTVEVVPIPDAVDHDRTAWGKLIVEEHRRTNGGLTLAVANTVDAASALHAAVRGEASDVDVRLVHSRFRGLERAAWRDQFLRRGACTPGANRIIVATQVVEAGVDISADVLVTEMAPWPSLVQRFGRCARYGGAGRIVVVDRFHTDETAAAIDLKKNEDHDERRREDDAGISLPYALGELAAAATAVREMPAADPQALDAFEESLEPGRRACLYPYEPLHVLTRRELDDLFDTGPDLTGADLDVSRFVRSGEERDVSVWWWPVDDAPTSKLQPMRAALCPVPVGQARTWLKRGEKAPRAWVWDYLDGQWRLLRDRDVYPGQTILVDVRDGGYRADLGFTGKRPDSRTPPIATEGTARVPSETLRADLAQDHDDLSVSRFKTIATHGIEAAEMARSLTSTLGLSGEIARLLDLAARTHDLGKAHPVFAAAIRDKSPYDRRTDLAKAPEGRWHTGKAVYTHDKQSGPRRGFRHELASTLALFELLRRLDPFHPALLGPHRQLLEAAGISPDLPAENERLRESSGFVAEIQALDAPSFDLLVWLVCTHHGKVRATWQATPSDQEFDEDGRGQPLRGVREGDVLPATALAGASVGALPALTLRLDPASLGLSARYGSSWVERVAGLRSRHGPFVLAYLEALLRAADVRASRLTTADPLLAEAAE